MNIPRTLIKEEHQLYLGALRRFFEQEVAPFHSQWEEQGHVDRELWRKAGQLGFLCPCLPAEYGGSEVDFVYSTLLFQVQAEFCASGPGFGLHSDIVAPYILHYGSEELKRNYLPRMASGELVTAIAMTEPGTGSDLQAVATTALKDGTDYIINGSKTFITNGYLADLVIVVAKTDPSAGASGISLILVEANSPGFSKNKPLKKIGMKAQDTCELFFDNVRVPQTNRLGHEGAGFMYLMNELPQERLMIAVIAMEAIEAMLRDTIQYTRDRKAFGKPIAAFQNTRFELAEMLAKAAQARVFVDRCIELLVDKKLDVPTAAAAKLLTTELQCEVADRCLQLHGGYGYIWDYRIARAYADARVQPIYGGTNEIMKEIIGRTVGI
jgi:acyl-CoA dehydrogenase